MFLTKGGCTDRPIGAARDTLATILLFFTRRPRHLIKNKKLTIGPWVIGPWVIGPWVIGPWVISR